MHINVGQFWQFCTYHAAEAYETFACWTDNPISKEIWERLKQLDLKVIVADFSMGEDRPGGDLIIELLTSCTNACEAGYRIFNWYGEETEALCIGYRPEQLKVAVGDGGELLGIDIL